MATLLSRSVLNNMLYTNVCVCVCLCVGVWWCPSPSSSVQMWFWCLQALTQWRVISLLWEDTMSQPSVSTILVTMVTGPRPLFESRWHDRLIVLVTLSWLWLVCLGRFRAANAAADGSGRWARCYGAGGRSWPHRHLWRIRGLCLCASGRPGEEESQMSAIIIHVSNMNHASLCQPGGVGHRLSEQYGNVALPVWPAFSKLYGDLTKEQFNIRFPLERQKRLIPLSWLCVKYRAGVRT